jgi:hypothetical protein
MSETALRLVEDISSLPLGRWQYHGKRCPCGSNTRLYSSRLRLRNNKSRLRSGTSQPHRSTSHSPRSTTRPLSQRILTHQPPLPLVVPLIWPPQVAPVAGAANSPYGVFPIHITSLAAAEQAITPSELRRWRGDNAGIPQAQAEKLPAVMRMYNALTRTLPLGKYPKDWVVLVAWCLIVSP